jgi:hypothetical protein
MRDLFPEHFKATEAEMAALWKNAIFAFDTNILLNLYRYSDRTRRSFIEILKALEGRIWLPRQAAEEFFKNRLSTISHNEDTYKNTLATINRLEDQLQSPYQHPFISAGLLDKLNEVLNETKQELEKSIEEHHHSLTDDKILHEISGLFNSRVGPEHDPKEIEAICKDGELRYKRKIPPGFADKQKPTETNPAAPYGDLILWKELIKRGKDSDCDIILVTDDAKDDWWENHKGLTIGPHPALIREFRVETKRKFHLLRAESFIELAGLQLGINVAANSVDEVKSVGENVQGKFSESPASAEGENEWILHAMQRIANLRSSYIVAQSELARLQARYSNIAELPDSSALEAEALRRRIEQCECMVTMIATSIKAEESLLEKDPRIVKAWI